MLAGLSLRRWVEEIGCEDLLKWMSDSLVLLCNHCSLVKPVLDVSCEAEKTRASWILEVFFKTINVPFWRVWNFGDGQLDARRYLRASRDEFGMLKLNGLKEQIVGVEEAGWG